MLPASFCGIWLLLMALPGVAASDSNQIPATGYLRYYTNHTIIHYMSHKTRSPMRCALVCHGSVECVGYSYAAGECFLYDELILINSHLYRDSPDDLDGVYAVWGLITSYLGCWIDVGNNRALPSLTYMTNTLTPPICIALCKSNGYEYAGLQYSDECWCGDNYWIHGAADESDCDMPCDGDPSIMCGGHDRNSIYQV